MVYKSRKNGSLWVLPDGPFSKIKYLPIHEIDDVVDSLGKIDLIQTVSSDGTFGVQGTLKSAPELTTVTLTTYMSGVANWLERVSCPFALYVVIACEKRKKFRDWDRVFILDVRNILNIGRTNTVLLTEDKPMTHRFELEVMPNLISLTRMEGSPILTFTDGEPVGFSFASSSNCCKGEVGIFNLDISESSLDTPSIYMSPEFVGKGDVWSPVPNNPFSTVAVRPRTAVGLVKISRRDYRILAGDSSQSQLSYSDDKGETWTLVSFATEDDSVLVFDTSSPFALLLGTSAGKIYRSENLGLDWELSASTSAQVLHIRMANPSSGYAVLSDGKVLKTTDGGRNWTTVSALNRVFSSLHVFDPAYLVLGDENGKLWVSKDGGNNWGNAQLPTTKPILTQTWLNKYYGIVSAGQDGTYMTLDGGMTWEAFSTLPSFGSILMADTSVLSLSDTHLYHFKK